MIEQKIRLYLTTSTSTDSVLHFYCLFIFGLGFLDTGHTFSGSFPF